MQNKLSQLLLNPEDYTTFVAAYYFCVPLEDKKRLACMNGVKDVVATSTIENRTENNMKEFNEANIKEMIVKEMQGFLSILKDPSDAIVAFAALSLVGKSLQPLTTLGMLLGLALRFGYTEDQIKKNIIFYDENNKRKVDESLLKMIKQTKELCDEHGTETYQVITSKFLEPKN